MTEVVAQSLAARLLTGSLEGAVVIAAIWALCRFLPAVPPGVQSALWWVAALKLIAALLPLPVISVPLLPAEEPAVIAMAPPGPHIPAGGSAARIAVAGDGRATSPATTAASSFWTRVGIALWLAVVLVHAGRLTVAAHRLRGVVARAIPLPPDEAAAVDRIVTAAKVSRRPDVRTSPEIDAPQVAGVVFPVVLLPARTFDAEERSMMLCHELMHIRRRDLAWGWVPALAERLFFFHPLARLATREYVVAREAACDAAVVRALDVAPADYARMLFRLGLSGGEPALTAGSAPASRASLKRRLEMLHHVPTDHAARRAMWLPAVVACALIPLQLGARSPAAASEDQVTPARNAAMPVTEAPAPASSARLVERAIGERIASERPDAPGQPEAVVRISEEWQEAANAHRQIERSLQELTDEYSRRLAEMGDRSEQGFRRDGSAAAFRQLIEQLQQSERALWERVDELGRRGYQPTHPDTQVARRMAEEASRAVRELELAEQGASVARQVERAERDAREAREVERAERDARAAREVERAERDARETREVERAERAAREVERADRAQGDQLAAVVRDQLERLVREHDRLVGELERLAAQQREIAREQRRLLEEAQRLRQQLDAP